MRPRFSFAAKAVALHIKRSVRQPRAADNAPIRVLMNGNPGIGKTGLALYRQRLLGCDKWSTTKLNGTQFQPTAKHIANFACGNVRQALLDAIGVLQQTAELV
jgi:hypothetical protein